MGKNRAGTPQRVRTEVRLGPERGLLSEVTLTPAGLWAVAGIVGVALIGTAVVVWTGRRPLSRALPVGASSETPQLPQSPA